MTSAAMEKMVARLTARVDLKALAEVDLVRFLRFVFSVVQSCCVSYLSEILLCQLPVC
jgi:hypothetical protein